MSLHKSGQLEEQLLTRNVGIMVCHSIKTRHYGREMLDANSDELGLGGGQDGVITIDLKNFQQFSMDNKTWQATIGAGSRLGDVTDRLHDAGGRAMAHGVCPDVGIGGHATIVGLRYSNSMTDQVTNKFIGRPRPNVAYVGKCFGPCRGGGSGNC